MASMSPVNGPGHSRASSSGGSTSPRQYYPPKAVAFELLFPESPQRRARLPMRVSIYPHDSTESIVTTVKNFYGLYPSAERQKGVSFEDQRGNTLIARYENFHDNMVVYVRIIDEPASHGPFSPQHYGPEPSPTRPLHYEGDQYPAPYSYVYDNNMSRPASRSSGRRSLSPNAPRGRRSASASGTGKSARSSRIRGTSQTDAQSDALHGYSSGDGAPGSSSGKSKEQLGNTDISVENIVEGGRRKRAKFESSELPLFAPPQMPAATSNPSVSPARRVDPNRASLPTVQGQNPFTHPRTMQSPQTYNMVANDNLASPASGDRRSRGSMSYVMNGAGAASAMGVLPTPDPTVGSCMSEEDKDVAIQLMRLGDMSNISHGRTSASTLDDTFSGRADATSSTGATSDGESEGGDELPPARRQRLDDAGASKLVYETTEARLVPLPQQGGLSNGGHASLDDVDASYDTVAFKTSIEKSSVSKSGPKPPKGPRPPSAAKTSKKLPPMPTGAVGTMSPPRKNSVTSVGSLLPGEDDQPDLSSKPRCQRCRKSKKGCDRQRPCGRCRDAGLSADQCISEDEGNGRKGRYGRHMGVPITKEDHLLAAAQPMLLPAAPIATAAMIADKNKKRKR